MISLNKLLPERVLHDGDFKWHTINDLLFSQGLNVIIFKIKPYVKNGDFRVLSC